MRKYWLWVAGGLLLLLGGGAAAYTFGGKMLRSGVDRDPNKLLPGFAKKVDLLFKAMRARGFRPMLWEGYRTPERAAQLSEQGVGIANSLHIYGAAADIVDESTAPDYWKGAPGFWTALGEEAEKLGLTWGGRWTKRDLPHVQAIPVAQQVAFRKMSRSEQEKVVA